MKAGKNEKMSLQIRTRCKVTVHNDFHPMLITGTLIELRCMRETSINGCGLFSLTVLYDPYLHLYRPELSVPFLCRVTADSSHYPSQRVLSPPRVRVYWCPTPGQGRVTVTQFDTLVTGLHTSGLLVPCPAPWANLPRGPDCDSSSWGSNAPIDYCGYP
ncbi:hypothetical protein E1301_Tti014850 [Triplophysa tibetana]|uniref:Uncharacterized protein n=1 Tax=Triplophysa tibetana TaxID=1572043 RepID=A0A5A9ND87_9TELE|nr:hypothetical protein E1301_Tti014850 [Triplophysa tibetana]